MSELEIKLELTRAIVAVSKSEIVKRQAQYERERGKKLAKERKFA